MTTKYDGSLSHEGGMTYTAISLDEVADELCRRANESRHLANQAGTRTMRAQYNVQAMAFDDAASIVRRTRLAP